MTWDPVSFRRRVLAVIQRIPRGKVATYGQIAALAGFPRNARRVGQVLGRTGANDVPWQRVVNSQGRVAQRALRPERAIGAREHHQEQLLKAEGIAFKGGKLSLAKYRWNPRGKPATFPKAAKAAPKAKSAKARATKPSNPKRTTRSR